MVEREPPRARDGRGPVLTTPQVGQRGRGSAARWDGYVIAGALVLLSVVAWFFVARTTHAGMSAGLLTRPAAGEGMSMTGAMPALSLAVFLATWTVMVVAMMFPATAPVVLLFDRWCRRRGRTAAATVAFVAGYLSVWSSVGFLAFVATTVLTDRVEGSTATVRIGGLVLVAAGIYQLSPAKVACLTKCRSPLGLVMEHARHLGRGLLGPLRVGLVHGAYCLGCCWALMAVLLALGVMNLGWMAAVSALVLVEKLLPHGVRFARVAGVGLAADGVLVVVTGGG